MEGWIRILRQQRVEAPPFIFNCDFARPFPLEVSSFLLLIVQHSMLFLHLILILAILRLQLISSGSGMPRHLPRPHATGAGWPYLVLSSCYVGCQRNVPLLFKRYTLQHWCYSGHTRPNLRRILHSKQIHTKYIEHDLLLQFALTNPVQEIRYTHCANSPNRRSDT